MAKEKKSTGKKASKKEQKAAGKVVPVSKKAKADAKPAKKDTSKNGAKADKPKAEKKTSAKANVGMYIHNGRLVKIEWSEETAKKVKANSEVHKDAPLFKDRVYKHNEKALAQHNKLVDEIEKLSEKAKAVLDKVGLHFA